MLLTSQTLMGQFAHDGLVLGLGTKQTVIKTRDSGRILATLHWFLTPRSDKEVDDAVQSGQIVMADVEKLIELKALIRRSEEADHFAGVYRKTALYYDQIFGDGQKVLQAFADYTFYLVGAGGIGNFTGYALAMHPAKGLYIIDFDTVEESNLNRQFLFTENDLGKYKASLLKEKLQLRNPEAHIEYSLEGGDAESLDKMLSSTDGKKFAIVSADSEGLLAEITPVLVKHRTPFLNVGYLNDISVIGPLWAPGHACPLCGNTLSLVPSPASSKSERYLKDINADYSAPSAFPNNAVASSMAMLDVAAFVSENFGLVQSFDKRLGMANGIWKRMELPIHRDPECRYCEC
ncbi:ThiF family adenylyltransferase [Bifidobacterium dentium]|uniref:ThiF family adenylyltransferase n=1 Tax=Bifidobacterium dentium TaxID=1689 RepID=UPI003D1864C3